jgi:transposase-like protein
MAERRTRRRFTAEFKAQAVKRVLDGRSLSEVATELGLSTGQLSTWRTEHLAAGSAEALAQRKAEEAEMQRLRLGRDVTWQPTSKCCCCKRICRVGRWRRASQPKEAGTSMPSLCADLPGHVVYWTRNRARHSGESDGIDAIRPQPNFSVRSVSAKRFKWYFSRRAIRSSQHEISC